MTGRVQTLRSSVAGNRPTGRQPGELYVNWADNQLGVINASNAAQDLLAVRFFSAQSNYTQGSYVVQGTNLYSANAAVPAGAFNAAQWSLVGGNVVVSDTAPTTPNNGQLWWDSVGGNLYVWYTDANSSQWVVAVNNGPPVTTITPIMDGVAAVGVNNAWARGDHVHPSDTTKLNLSGGTMTGPLVTPGVSAPQAMGDNRIINGNMSIDQRNAGAAGTATGYTVDRWQYISTQANLINWQRQNGALGFGYSLAFVAQGAYTLLATDLFSIMQAIEVDMVSDFQWGSTSAQPVTLSFVAFSQQAGTYSGSIRNYAGTRSYPFTFNLAANTWTRIVITIPGDTAGAWVMSGNAGSVYVTFDLGCGANFRAPANAWASGNYIGATGSVSVVNSGSLWITGVKLEIGSIATPFNRQSLAKLFADCQRYYQIQQYLLIGGNTISTGAFYGGFLLPVTMRTSPTPTYWGQSYYNAQGLTTQQAAPNLLTISATATVTGYAWAQTNVQLDAEL